MRKLRADSYEAQLTKAQRRHVQRLLFQPALTFVRMRDLAPAWRLGRYAGKKPSIQTLHKTRRRAAMAEKPVLRGDMSRLVV